MRLVQPNQYERLKDVLRKNSIAYASRRRGESVAPTGCAGTKHFISVITQTWIEGKPCISGTKHFIARAKHFISRPKHFIAGAKHFIAETKHCITDTEHFMSVTKRFTGGPKHFMFKTKHCTTRPTQFILVAKRCIAAPMRFKAGTKPSILVRRNSAKLFLSQPNLAELSRKCPGLVWQQDKKPVAEPPDQR